LSVHEVVFVDLFASKQTAWNMEEQVEKRRKEKGTHEFHYKQ
jgi:hypothetical protein